MLGSSFSNERSLSMDTAMAPRHESTVSTGVLYIALELSAREWRLAHTTSLRAPIRQVVIRAGDRQQLRRAVWRAKAQWGLAADAEVRSCYEAGRDGFWPHRLLEVDGVENVVVDSSSIEVNRRARHAKTDRLDARKLVRLLVRWALGERDVWHQVHVPTPAQEAARQQSRTIAMLTGERTRWRNRIHSALATVGVPLRIDAAFPARLAAAQQWDGTAVPLALQRRVLVAWRLLQQVDTELRALRQAQHRATQGEATVAARTAHRLTGLRGIGERVAWVLATELCSRDLRNRRQVGALTGFTSDHYRSGALAHDQGISRAGLAPIRSLAVETAWLWIQWQPQSALTQWFHARFAHGGPGGRRRGIVALARRLVIALWRYAREGTVPAGAVLTARAA
jgi:transposase